MLEPLQCREHAKECLALAAQTTNPLLKQRLQETAQGWMRLATDLARYNNQPAVWADRMKRSA